MLFDASCCLSWRSLTSFEDDIVDMFHCTLLSVSYHAWRQHASPLRLLTYCSLLHRTLSRADFPCCQQLSPEYALHWAVANGSMTLGIEAAAGDGWVGFGLSDTGG